MSSVLLEVEHLELHFPPRTSRTLRREHVGQVRAVDDVSFQLRAGETLGLVGESGCGKTTLVRTLMRLLDPTAGTIRFRGEDITRTSRRSLAPVRQHMQMVFQDPFGSLNPRRTVRQTVAAPLRLQGVAKRDALARVPGLLEQVGLASEHAGRYPHEFSGGQRQRIGIARALALEPDLLVLDEPVSALDVSVQAQVVNLLADLQRDLGLAYLLVAHDLSVVRHVSDRVAVMYLGKLMEVALAQELYARPIHPYTQLLLDAVPAPDPRLSSRRRRGAGRPVPEPDEKPAAGGCAFHPRCPRASDLCRSVEPPLTRYAGGRLAACHHPLNVTAAEVAAAERSPASPLGAGTEPPLSS